MYNIVNQTSPTCLLKGCGHGRGLRGQGVPGRPRARRLRGRGAHGARQVRGGVGARAVRPLRVRARGVRPLHGRLRGHRARAPAAARGRSCRGAAGRGGALRGAGARPGLPRQLAQLPAQLCPHLHQQQGRGAQTQVEQHFIITLKILNKCKVKYDTIFIIIFIFFRTTVPISRLLPKYQV